MNYKFESSKAVNRHRSSNGGLQDDGMSVFCHVNDQVLADEEGCVSPKGVMIRHDGIKKRQISTREPDGKEVIGQQSSSKGPVTRRVSA